MTPKAFRELLSAAKVSQVKAAAMLHVQRRTVVRWLSGETPISEPNALYIRSIIKPNRK